MHRPVPALCVSVPVRCLLPPSWRLLRHIAGWVLDVHVGRAVRGLATLAGSRGVQAAHGGQLPFDALVHALVLSLGAVYACALVGTSVVPLLTLGVHLSVIQTSSLQA